MLSRWRGPLVAAFALVAALGADEPEKEKPARRLNTVRMIFTPEYQSQLALNTEQKDAVDKAKREYDERMAQFKQEFEPRLKEILSDSQEQKLEQMKKTAAPERHFGDDFRDLIRPAVLAKLDLAAEQKAQIEALDKDWTTKTGAYHVEIKTRLLGLLTEQQRKTLDEIKPGPKPQP